MYSNGSSTPPRLPLLSSVLKQLYKQDTTPAPTEVDAEVETDYTVIAPSYRGFWKSHGRPSQRGIELDALASLRWVKAHFAAETQIVLWGQSIGAGVATGLAATNNLQTHNGGGGISALILETPFISVSSMLLALYPQRWLPYRYLSPFLRSSWDSQAAIRSLANKTTNTTTTTAGNRQAEKPKVLIVSAARDELVPADQALFLHDLCAGSGLEVRRCVVGGALHGDATVRSEGRDAVVGFLRYLRTCAG